LSKGRVLGRSFRLRGVTAVMPRRRRYRRTRGMLYPSSPTGRRGVNGPELLRRRKRCQEAEKVSRRKRCQEPIFYWELRIGS
jgi:hypothetical protein